MAIRWRPRGKRAKVQRILKKHDVHSSQCDRASRAIFPLAKGQDDDARLWLLLPDPYPGPCLLPAGLESTPMWFFHVSVATEEHCVCALTGADGFSEGRYIQEKFQYPDGVSKTELRDWESLQAMMSEMSLP